MTDQLRINDCSEIESQPLTWDGEPVYSPSTVREGLFDPEAFEQMRGQMAMSEDRHTADQRAYETRRDVLLDIVGERARITWPNGAQRSGAITSRKIGDETLACIDGSTLMGELCPAVSVERMESGRYRRHWSASDES